MIPGPFEYHAPASLSEAVALLSEHGLDAKLLAGGQSLIPLMKFRFVEPAVIVDLNRIPGLGGIRRENGHLVLGALTREAELEDDEAVRTEFPIILDTAVVIADPLVRNLATVGGNLAHADPANDHPATMLALGAEIVATGPNGERTIPIDEFFVDTFTTALAADEVLTAIRIPIPGPRSGGAYVKFERKAGDYAISGAAVQLTLDDAGQVASVRIGLTNVNYMPMRAKQAEAALLGKEPTEEAIREAARLAGEECDPSSDLRGPADYKRAVTRTVTARALRRALERAGAAAA